MGIKYLHSLQVCSVLDSLEREYKRDEDWCKGKSGAADKISQLIIKHQEQKEAFLKACTLARRTAETFLKYTSRSLQYYNYSQDTSPENSVKSAYYDSISSLNLLTIIREITARMSRSYSG